MGLFNDVVNGFVNGFVAGATSNGSVSQSRRGVVDVEQLCRELGWSVDERFGDKGVVLHFRDPVINVRKVLVVPDYFTLIRTYSGAVVAGNALPKEVLGHLLSRNRALTM